MPWRDSLALEQQERKNQNLWRSRELLASAQSVEVKRNGRLYLNFCNNDYLGLANHPASIAAAIGASSVWGTGSGASHLVCGHQESHRKLERELADFVGAEQAVLFSTGYMANLAVPQSLLRRGDLLLQDKLNHASLVDAASLCRADFKRYRHADLDQLSGFLANPVQPGVRKLIGTDSVFSMDGDIAPITELDQLAAGHGAVLLIDDAHGLGVLGKGGRGSYSHFGLKPSGHRLMLGTLGKAIGSFGAFVAGDDIYIDQIVQHARTYIYTTALPAAVAEATRAALGTVEKDSFRREKLSRSISYLRSGIKALGLDLMDSQTPIQPILFGREATALQASAILEQEGIWVSAIRPPTVLKGSSRLRITLSANHSAEHLDQLLNSLSNVREALN